MNTFSTAIDERFRAAAAAEGLLDVAYDILADTPIGPLLVGVTEYGVCRIWFDPEPERNLETLARLHGPRVLRVSAPVDRVRRELDEYFAGVEYGTTTTYGTLAAQSGNPRAARAVGTVMNRNPVPIVLPCHRVVGASGNLTGYAGGLDRKEQLLRLEGALL